MAKSASDSPSLVPSRKLDRDMQAPPETQVVIDFDENRAVSALVGPYGQNLALIERRLGVVVDSRGNHITIAGKETAPCDHKYDVTGSLCENNDKFAIDRMLPKIDIGDLVIIHDTGAHGSAMGFNYNGKLWCAELLLREDGSIELIRRAETLDDYFATLKYPGSVIK